MLVRPSLMPTLHTMTMRAETGGSAMTQERMRLGLRWSTFCPTRVRLAGLGRRELWLRLALGLRTIGITPIWSFSAASTTDAFLLHHLLFHLVVQLSSTDGQMRALGRNLVTPCLLQETLSSF